MLHPVRLLSVALLILLGVAIPARNAGAGGGMGGTGVGMGIGGYYPGICGATGTVTANCPSYRKPERGSDRPAPPYRYQTPSEECRKSGWGTVMCPSYGAKEEYGGKAEEEAQKPAYQPKPLDECMKTGWGITECPNYNRKTGE